MIIGIPKEIKKDEQRVGLIPNQVQTLISDGHKVLIEKGSGVLSGYEDDEYAKNGAEIVDTQQVWNAEMVVKVKTPQDDEINYLKDGQILFGYMHFDENIPSEITQRIIDTGVTSIAYEWVCDNDKMVLLNPMSIITGKLFALRTMELLTKHKGIIPVDTAHVLLIGVGTIGSNALDIFVRNGLTVDVVDKHPETVSKRANISDAMKEHINLIKFDESYPNVAINKIHKRMGTYDIVLNCAVRRPTMPKSICKYIIDRDMVRSMPDNGIISDATACEADLIETCFPSEELDEIYIDEGIIHYNCDHIPSYSPRTSTNVLTEATFPYVQHIAKHGFEKSIELEALKVGVMCHKKKMVHKYSCNKKNLEYTPIDIVIGDLK